MWTEWRSMSFPRELKTGGSAHIVNGIDTEQLVGETVTFLDRFFAGNPSTAAASHRDQLVARFDRAIPELQKEPRGYLAMGREVLRRVVFE
jgi:hypothetical protein